MPAKHAHRADIGEDLAFQRRNWRAQRVGWVLLGLLIAAGLAGLLGPGPLSDVSARDGERLEVEYERFVRHGSPSDIRVTIPRPGTKLVRVAVSRDYLDAVWLMEILPTPMRVQAADSDVVYTFERLGSGPLEATFGIRPKALGTHEARIALDDGSRVSVRQFTYP